MELHLKIAQFSDETCTTVKTLFDLWNVCLEIASVFKRCKQRTTIDTTVVLQLYVRMCKYTMLRILLAQLPRFSIEGFSISFLVNLYYDVRMTRVPQENNSMLI